MDDDEVRRLVHERTTRRRRSRPRRHREREAPPVPPEVLARVQKILDDILEPDPQLEAMRRRAEIEALMQPDIPPLAATVRRHRRGG